MSTSAAIKRPEENTLRRFNTPTAATQILLSRAHIDGVISEPMVGDGAISNVLRAHLDKRASVFEDPIPDRGLWTNDLDPAVAADFHLDACRPDSWPKISGGRRPDWIVTNPEFSIAHVSVPLALEICLVGIAMLLRITWLEPTEDRQPRGEWLAVNPPSHLIVLPRISFKVVTTVVERKDGLQSPLEKTSSTDSATCAWYIWYKASNGVNESYRRNQKIEIVTKREMRELCQMENPQRQLLLS